MNEAGNILNVPAITTVNRALMPAAATALPVHSRAYYQVFVLSLVVCWSPLKGLAYLVPFIAIAWFAYKAGSEMVVKRFLIWSGAWAALVTLHLIFNPNFVLSSAVIFLVTYGSFAFLFAVPDFLSADPKLLKKITKASLICIFIQGGIGIVQGLAGFVRSGSFDEDNGDVVMGTIHLVLTSDGTFANYMFGVSMALLLICILPRVLAGGRRWAVVTFVLGSIALVLASVVHVLIFLFMALVFAYLFHRPPLPRKQAKFIATFGILLAPAATFLLLNLNLMNLPNVATQLLAGEYPRSIAFVRTIVLVPMEYPLAPVTGLGPGQYCSRAALIGTGLFFGDLSDPKSVPLVPVAIPKPLDDYIMNLWLWWKSGPFGTTQEPSFSWLSVYAELGVIVVLVILGYAIAMIRGAKARATTPESKVLAMCFTAGVLFLLLLGCQENYWELPQAIFPGCVFLKCIHANLTATGQVPGFSKPERY